VFGFNHFTLITVHPDSNKDVVFNAAIVAETLLPGRDAHWDQSNDGLYVLMGFLHQEDRDAFQSHWNGLNNAEWYNSGPGEFPSTVDCTSPHVRRCVLPFDTLREETDRIHDALVNGGIPHAERLELTNLATQSKLAELDCLADQMGIEGFHIWEGDQHYITPLLLTFSDDNNISRFMKAAQQIGFN
jgi:hypothetical protein